jgi:hypothetical protein
MSFIVRGTVLSTAALRIGSTSVWDLAVPALVVGAQAKYFCQHPQRWEKDVLGPDRGRGYPALMAEVPKGGTELERVLRRTPRAGRPIGHQAGDGFVELFRP